MSEKYINQLAQFRTWRTDFLPVLESAVEGLATTSGAAENALEAWGYYQSLMLMPVSKLSKFGDAVWDFNADDPHAARNVKGAKLKIDFTKYTNLNATAILEVKAALNFYLLAPAAVAGDTPRSKKTVKYNTAIANFESGLRFVDRMYACAIEEYKAAFISSTCFSISQLDDDIYKKAAETFEHKYSNGLSRFFSILRSPFLRDSIFGNPLSNKKLESLPWKLEDIEEDEDGDEETLADQEDETNHLPNDVFESISNYASLQVVDFLDALSLPVQDANSLKRRNVKGFRMGDQYGLTPRLMELYTVLRLGAKGYDYPAVMQLLGAVPDGVSIGDKLVSRDAIEKLAGGLIHNDFRKYLNLVNYSCCYLVAQYTGMRPSELSELMVDSCLIQEGKYWLLESRVIKHQQADRKLFDDKWIAIPIIRDAIEAARVIARYKQSPYLFSSVDTIAPDSTCMALHSGGIKHQLQKLFSAVLTQQQYESLEFSPYTLRHTLAFQMYRIDLGLPFISHQLKHFGEIVGGYAGKGVSKVTLGYGGIGDIIAKGGRHVKNPLRREAEIEAVKDFYDPDGGYAGVNASAHKARNQQFFKGCMAAGYTKDQIIAAMADQGMAIVNVGLGFCYGNKTEDFDDVLPCAGGLRCNPNKCSNSVVGDVHAPKWREVYYQNKALLDDPMYADRRDQIEEIMKEASGVLKYLGQEVED